MYTTLSYIIQRQRYIVDKRIQLCCSPNYNVILYCVSTIRLAQRTTYIVNYCVYNMYIYNIYYPNSFRGGSESSSSATSLRVPTYLYIYILYYIIMSCIHSYSILQDPPSFVPHENNAGHAWYTRDTQMANPRTSSNFIHNNMW